MQNDERLWRWFARIHHLKTGEKLPLQLNSMVSDWSATLFDYWQSGYKCRQLDEESQKQKEGVLK